MFQNIMSTVVSFRNSTHKTIRTKCSYFVLITWLIEYRKELAKTTAKSFKDNKAIFNGRFQTWARQKSSNEILLVWFKFQLKIPSLFGVCVQGECEIVSK